MKVLLTASVLCHIALFHKQLINMLKEHGHTVHVAARDDLAEKDGLKLENIDRLYNIAFQRSPFSLANLPAYRELRHIIESEHYDIIHCHTPAVGVLTRLAARHARQQHGTRVFYTAHGFHFYKGVPFKNWLLYYPIEKFMCRYTDTLVTINEEDTQLVQNRFRVRNFHMHGVGADSGRFFPVNEETKRGLRQQLGFQPEHHLILCAAELIPRKNLSTLLRMAALLAPRTPGLHILLAGNGPQEHRLRALIREGELEKCVTLLGYCSNIQQYVQAADIIVSCSYQEGLPVNIMEAMMAAKPVVASDNRGHRELVQEGRTGFLVPPTAAEAYADCITRLLSDTTLYCNMSRAAEKRAHLFADTRVRPELENLYELQTGASAARRFSFAENTLTTTYEGGVQ